MTKYKKIAIIGGSVVAAVAIVFGVLMIIRPGHKLPVDEPNSSVSSAPTAPETTEPSDTTTTTVDETPVTTVPETTTTTKAPDKPTTTKKPATTTKQPPATTTRTPTTQPVKDEGGIQVEPGYRPTPEEVIRNVGATMDIYLSEVEKYKTYKCRYCNLHNCKSLTYVIDANGDAYSVHENKWNCPVYSSETHYCKTCGKKMCSGDDYDTPNFPTSEYCLGTHKTVE